MMIWLFLKEHAAWIGFFFVTLIWSNVVFTLDAGFSGVSILYFNIIQFVLLILFLGWRFIIDRKAVRALLDSTVMEDIKPSGMTAFQSLYRDQFLKELEEKAQKINELSIQRQEESDDLLAWVHEMKAPLTAIKLMVEQVEEVKLRTKLEQEWLRIYLLLDQQLHQTRLLTIEQDNRLEQVGIRQIVYKEIRDFQSWCMEKGIGFEVDELDQTVKTDAKWLGFIVRQVLSNAIKYSPENEMIHITHHKDSDGHLVLQIRDVGTGIKAEDLPRVFKKSYTGTVGRESSAATGMGLYLAKSVAVKLGINLKIDSTVGKGTTVMIQFPKENAYDQSYGM
ncbi:sensor histidine kinase [Lysinibacillus odysseyi]|nr:sensor histidine kinase [Lysinibacillus odysseyi]